MNKWFNVFCLALTLFVFCPSISHGYDMADYWCFNEGNVCIYDRDIQLVGKEMRVFGGYAGIEFLQGREFCNTGYVYAGTEGVMVVGIYSRESGQYVDLSAYPIKLSNATMNIGDSVNSNVPQGVIEDYALNFTITLVGTESVTVPAGTFTDVLKLKLVVEDGIGLYTEWIWLAKNVGPVKMYRQSETNNTHGCFFTCGSFGYDSDVIEDRYIELKSYSKTRYSKTRVVVVPF